MGTLIALVIAVAAALLVYESRQRRREELLLRLAVTFAPAIANARKNPNAFVAWSGIARRVRKLFPEAFHQLDSAGNGRFPFSRDLIEAVHAQWTTEWLTWERQHDLEYKQRTQSLELESEGLEGRSSEIIRSRIEVIEQEKLQRYQERYEEYVRIGKAIADLEE